MNIKRGLFRIWVLLSALLVIATAILGGSQLVDSIEDKRIIESIQAGEVEGLPVRCVFALGVAQVDYTQGGGPWWRYSSDKDICWYTVSKLREKYPQYQDMPADKMTLFLYERANVSLPTPDILFEALALVAFAFGYPLAFLALGSAIYWAFAGFAGKRKPEAEG